MEQAAAEALLREKANLLRESMRRSESTREDAAVALASISDHMAAIDEAMRPAQERTWSACRVHDNVGRSLRAAAAIVRQLDRVHEAECVILNKPSKGLSTYLDTVDKLRSAEYFFTSKRSCTAGDDVLKRVDELLSKAAVELENEFSRLLSRCSKPIELERLFNCLPSHPSAKDSSEGQLNPDAVCSLPTLVDPRYMPLLSKLVQKSVQLGRHKQFLKIYRDIRSSTLKLTLKQLGVEYVTKEEVQTVQAESLDAKIAQWIQCFQIAAEREMQKGPHQNLQGFLDAVDQLRSIKRFFSSNRSYSSSDRVLNHVNALLSKALVKMESEFQNQLSQRSKLVEPDRLFDCLPSTLRPSSESHPDGGKYQSAVVQSENQQNSEAAVYSPPALIEPKFVPLLAC